MKALVARIRELEKGEVGKTVRSRIKSFKELGKKTSPEIFQELCFCILTANYSAEGGIRIQEAIRDGFCHWDEPRLASELKRLGYRFPNKRAEYISCSKVYSSKIRDILNAYDDPLELRKHLAEDVKGLGYKEASHFLRNIGYDDLAIIDFHIIDLLVENGLIEKPKTITKKNYLEIEEVLRSLAKKAGLTLAELDLYLWYLETGKILK